MPNQIVKCEKREVDSTCKDPGLQVKRYTADKMSVRWMNIAKKRPPKVYKKQLIIRRTDLQKSLLKAALASFYYKDTSQVWYL